MRTSWVIAVVCLLPGCAVFQTDCSLEKAELRSAESAIAHASRQHKAGFTAKLASRGHANYHCVAGQGGHLRCSKAPTNLHGVDMGELYHKRDAAAARVVKLCH